MVHTLHIIFILVEEVSRSFLKLNYKAIFEFNDLDYEISSFGSRLNAKGIKRVIFNMAIPFLSLITKISKSHDSKIISFVTNQILQYEFNVRSIFHFMNAEIKK